MAGFRAEVKGVAYPNIKNTGDERRAWIIARARARVSPSPTDQLSRAIPNVISRLMPMRVVFCDNQGLLMRNSRDFSRISRGVGGISRVLCLSDATSDFCTKSSGAPRKPIQAPSALSAPTLPGPSRIGLCDLLKGSGGALVEGGSIPDRREADRPALPIRHTVDGLTIRRQEAGEGGPILIILILVYLDRGSREAEGLTLILEP